MTYIYTSDAILKLASNFVLADHFADRYCQTHAGFHESLYTYSLIVTGIWVSHSLKISGDTLEW